MKRQLTCAEAFRQLDDYVDRELGATDAAEVEEHLARCVDCAEEFGVERELLDKIREKLAGLRMPPELAERIRARLRQDPA